MVLKLSFSLFISQMLLCLLDEYRLNRLSCSPACFRFHPHHGAWFASGAFLVSGRAAMRYFHFVAHNQD
jgi:hypothetical protein